MPTHSENASHGHAVFPWVQLVSLVVGGALFLFGLVGFWWTGFVPLPPTEHGPTLLGMELNPLRAVAYVLLGIAGLACAASLRATRAYGWVLAAVAAVFTVFGVVTMVAPGTDVLSMNLPSTLMSLVLVAVGLVVALGRVRSAAPYASLQRTITRAGRRAGPAEPSARDETGPR